ncbi:hypothetical protein KAH55_07465 [bacterium]|nr:hypothetical protein [bacterium]
MDTFVKKYGLLSVLIGVVVILMLLVGSLMFSGKQNMQIPGSQIRELANKLYEWKLYPEAIHQYQYYLDFYTADKDELGNINYIIANIYFDRLRDYQGALTHYAMVKYFSPKSNLVSDVNKKIVACLERLERTQDARQVLNASTALDTEQVLATRPGTVIAEFGDRKVTQGDLDFELTQLPAYVQEQFKAPEDKKKFLEQFIATELMYETAKRAGLDQDKEVIQGAFQAKKQLMAQKYLEQEITRDMSFKPEDVELYFKANSEKYAERDEDGEVTRQKSLAEVQQQVAQDLIREKQTKAYQELIDRLTRAQNVKIYDDKIK